MRICNFIMFLFLDIMPPYQISNMSMNALRRIVDTCDKTLCWTTEKGGGG
jgi:hypothetical protein